MKSRKDDYDPKITACLSQLLVVAEQAFKLEEVTLKDMEIGMRLAQELRLEEDGFLVASSGAEVDRQLLRVIKNYISCYEENPFPKKSSYHSGYLKSTKHRFEGQNTSHSFVKLWHLRCFGVMFGGFSID